MTRRWFLWFGGIAFLVLAVGAGALMLTPWPRVAVIQYVFAQGDRASEAALAKHVPSGIVSRPDLAYGPGADEKFDLYVPAGTPEPRPTIVWVHGGGWIAGSKAGVANYLKILASQGYTAIGLEYSHGFGSSYPTPVVQVNAALAYLVRTAADLQIDPGRIVLAGDSAGAQIASQVAILTTDAAYAQRMGIVPALDRSQLDAMVLVSGAYDPEKIDTGGGLGWFVKAVLWAYSGTRGWMEDERFRLASVTDYVTAAFPPAFVSSGNGDPLAPQARAFAGRLEELGVKTDTLFFPDDYVPPLSHEYQFDLDIAAGQEALSRLLGFLDRTMRRGET